MNQSSWPQEEVLVKCAKALGQAFPLDPSISRWGYPQKGVAEKVKIGVIPFMGSFLAIVWTSCKGTLLSSDLATGLWTGCIALW